MLYEGNKIKLVKYIQSNYIKKSHIGCKNPSELCLFDLFFKNKLQKYIYYKSNENPSAVATI